uniref:Uncharacterized protein n=1 Tax=Arundo donax TaxID=35708 RepID=A0A0A9H2V3_ARUDO
MTTTGELRQTRVVPRIEAPNDDHRRIDARMTAMAKVVVGSQ